MEIVVVDARQEAAFDEWFDVHKASERANRPEDTGWLRPEMRALALQGLPRPDGTPPPDERRDLLLARAHGRAAGAVLLELPVSDNRHAASFELGVVPQCRRRGVGGALLDAVVRRAREAGRTTLMADLDEPPQLLGRSPGRAFAESAGFACALVEVRRDLALPVPPERLDALERRSRPLARGYRTTTVTERWPEEWVEQRAELGRRMSTDAPLGALAWEEENWDADRVRRREELLRAQGRQLIGAAAVHEPTGRLVAFTELTVPRAAPQQVWQWDTLVLAEHRGHRLGTLVKIAATRRLQAEVPAARVVTTFNADTNRWMIDVNEALGFRTNGAVSSWQRLI